MMVPAFAYSAVQAIAAVSSGFCHTVLALRVIKQQPSGSAMAAGTAARDNPMVAVAVGGRHR